MAKNELLTKIALARLASLPRLDAWLPPTIQNIARYEPGPALTVTIAKDGEGRFFIYATWPELGRSKPMTPPMSPHDIVCLAEEIIGAGSEGLRARLATWPHATMVLAMAVTLLADTLLPPAPPEAEANVVPKPVPPAPLADGVGAEPADAIG